MYDLIIIGGGPAGSAAGRLAGQMSLETLLIEKEIFPRYKPCGGAFSEQAMSYLDFKVPEGIHERNVYGARVHFRENVIEKHKPYRISTLVTRSALDSCLIEKAKETGIETIMGEKVVSFQESDNYVEVRTDSWVSPEADTAGYSLTKNIFLLESVDWLSSCLNPKRR